MRRAFLLAILAACDGGGRSQKPVDPEPDAGFETPDAAEPVDAGPSGLAVLGSFTHSAADVVVEILGTPADGLFAPRDLAFNPAEPDELWVVNRGDESMVVYTGLGASNQRARRFWDPPGHHFLAQPSAIAFGAAGTFATIHETDEETQGPNGSPPDFMGPTLWTADLGDFDAGDVGHLDMLHNSPNGMGIAWERDNVYWVFDGYHGSITRYDFVSDHGLGGTDHSDGIIARYAEGQVARVPDVPSHMAFDSRTGRLYVADTGNNRIAVLDTTSGTRGQMIYPNYDGIDQHHMNGAMMTTLFDGASGGLSRPSGLALWGDILFVTDNAMSTIHAFTLEGEVVDWLVTELPADGLMGIEVDAEGRLYVVDSVTEQIVRISPK